jgi:hypothetical protein
MPNSSNSFEYVAFAVLLAKTVGEMDSQHYVAGISKVLIEEFCRQNPDTKEMNYFHLVLRIFELEKNQQEITLHLIAKLGSFETGRLMIDDFELPHTLPEPDFTISNGQILIWTIWSLGQRYATIEHPHPQFNLTVQYSPDSTTRSTEAT